MAGLMALFLALTLCGAGRAEGEKGLVTRYAFDEGSGSVLRDASGKNNHGRIHGAKWIKCGKGHALRFDGMDDYVDCGSGPSLDIRDAITLEAWVYPEGVPEGEPAIVGKYFTSYIMTYYRTGRLFLYISNGRNNASIPFPTGRWSHVAATFDGAALRIYVNGEMAAARPSKNKVIRPGGNLVIGRAAATPGADDPILARASHFIGMIDEVSIYNRALPGEEIRERYRQTNEARMTTAAIAFSPVSAGEEIRQKAFAVKVGRKGAMQIAVGNDAYIVESSFSYPGRSIGANVLSQKGTGSEESWTPTLERTADGTIQVAARGGYYSLRRRIRPRGARIKIEDELTNLTNAPVGIIIQHIVTAPRVFTDPHLTATAPNPTLFLSQPESRLGIVAEDNISRLQIKPIAFSNQAGFSVKHFALDARKNYTFRWAIYPFGKEADYFTFINRVREDWKSNFTIEGPASFAYFSARAGLVHDPVRLKKYLRRKKLRVVMFIDPWLDYHTGQDLTREQYKQILQKAQRNLKAADPEIKVMGNIESDWVPLRPEEIRGFEKLPVLEKGKNATPYLTPAQTKIVEDADLPWKDSYKRNAEGMLRLELYFGRRLDGNRVVLGDRYSAVAVYPEVGNYQYKFILEQMRFLLEDVGLDGVYIDEFNQYGSSCRTYDRWDGYTVDIDPGTGKIERKYTDCGLVGALARKKICEYVLSRGKVMVANTLPAVHETQSLPIFRFLELPLHNFNPDFLKEGQKPPLVTRLHRAHLGSPLGLGIGMGYWSVKTGSKDYARGFMKGIVTFLRHGLLYIHYDPDIPESGEGSGEYGPINLMFPITPVGLHEGWIEGKERTITCVSGTYTWRGPRAPRIFLFDPVGREKKHAFKPVKADAVWKVEITLRDWQEIAVIE